MRYLWAGVGVGVGLALALAAVMLGIARMLSEEGLEYFQLAMMLVASGLIVQMVFWMRRHGRTLRRELETEMQSNAATANWWGLLVVVALAVGRESAETVVFLYGLGAQYTSVWSFLGVLALGIVAAWLTFWALQQGSRFFSWRTFFRWSESCCCCWRRAARLCRRQIDCAGRGARARRPAVEHVRGARRLEPHRRLRRRLHRLSRTPRAAAAHRARRVLGDGRRVLAPIFAVSRLP